MLRHYLKKSKAKTPDGLVLVVQVVQKTIFDEVALDRCKQELEEVDPSGEEARLRAAETLYYLGLIQEICHPESRGDWRFYARALDELGKCSESPGAGRSRARSGCAASCVWPAWRSGTSWPARSSR